MEFLLGCTTVVLVAAVITYGVVWNEDRKRQHERQQTEKKSRDAHIAGILDAHTNLIQSSKASSEHLMAQLTDFVVKLEYGKTKPDEPAK